MLFYCLWDITIFWEKILHMRDAENFPCTTDVQPYTCHVLCFTALPYGFGKIGRQPPPSKQHVTCATLTNRSKIGRRTIGVAWDIFCIKSAENFFSDILESLKLLCYSEISFHWWPFLELLLCLASLLTRISWLPYWMPKDHKSLRSPLDWRIFIGKVEDSISYRIENYSCLWNGGLDHRNTVSVVLISKENRRKGNIQLNHMFLIPSHRIEANVPVAASTKGLGWLQVEHLKTKILYDYNNLSIFPIPFLCSIQRGLLTTYLDWRTLRPRIIRSYIQT